MEDLLRFSNALLAHKLLSPASTDLALAPKVRLGEKARAAVIERYSWPAIAGRMEDEYRVLLADRRMAA